MREFSNVVKAELVNQEVAIQEFAGKMGFSVQYIYDLLSERNGSRWNSNSIKKACEILGIEIQFKVKGR